MGVDVEVTSSKKLVALISLVVLPQLILKPSRCDAKAADRWKLRPLKKKKNTMEYLRIKQHQVRRQKMHHLLKVGHSTNNLAAHPVILLRLVRFRYDDAFLPGTASSMVCGTSTSAVQSLRKHQASSIMVHQCSTDDGDW